MNKRNIIGGSTFVNSRATMLLLPPEQFRGEIENEGQFIAPRVLVKRTEGSTKILWIPKHFCATLNVVIIILWLSVLYFVRLGFSHWNKFCSSETPIKVFPNQFFYAVLC